MRIYIVLKFSAFIIATLYSQISTAQDIPPHAPEENAALQNMYDSLKKASEQIIEQSPSLPKSQIFSDTTINQPAPIDIDVARDITYNMQRVRRYEEDPILYLHDHALINNSPYLNDIQKYMIGEMTARELSKHITSIGISAGIGVGSVSISADTKGLYDLTKDSDILTYLQQWTSNDSNKFQIANQVRELHYDSQEFLYKLFGDKSISNSLDIAERYDPKLPDPTDYKSLITQSSDTGGLYSFLKLDRFEREDFNDLINSKLSYKDYLKKTKQTHTEFKNAYIDELESNNYSLPHHIVEQNKAGLNIDDFNNDIDAGYNNLNAFTSVVTLFSPKEARMISYSGRGALGLSKGLGNMFMDGGTINAENITLAANGYGLILMAFQEDTQAKFMKDVYVLFEQVFENQKKLMEQLNHISGQIGALDNKITFLYEAMNNRFDITDAKINTVVDLLTKNYMFDIVQADQDTKTARDDAISSINDAASQLDTADRAIIRDRNNISSCWQSEECNDSFNRLKTRYIDYLALIKGGITEKIVNEQAFQHPRDLSSFDDKIIFNELSKPADDRIGLLPSINKYIKTKEKKYSLSDKQSNNLTTTFKRFGHPQYQYNLINSYVRTVIAYPNAGFESDDIKTFSREAQKVQNTSAASRNLVHLALDIYKKSAEEYTTTYLNKMQQHAQHLKSDNIQSRNKILFANMPVSEITDFFNRFTINQFIQFGKNANILQDENSAGRVDAVSASYTHPNGPNHNHKISVSGPIGSISVKFYYSHSTDKFNETYLKVDATKNISAIDTPMHYATTEVGTTTHCFTETNDLVSYSPCDKTEPFTRTKAVDVETSRLALTKNLVNSISQKQQFLHNILQSNIDVNNAFINFLQATLALDTLLQAGYGQCLEYDQELFEVYTLNSKIRSKKYAANRTQNEQGKTTITYKPTLLGLIINTQNQPDIYSLLNHIEKINKAINEYSVTLPENELMQGYDCSLGFTKQHKTKRILDISKQIIAETHI